MGPSVCCLLTKSLITQLEFLLNLPSEQALKREICARGWARESIRHESAVF